MDFWYFEDDEYFDDEMQPRDVDLRTLILPLKNGRFVGRKELFDCINAPVTCGLSIALNTRWTDTPIFRLMDDETAVIVSNSLVVARSEGHHAPIVQYQNCLNRWTFRRVDGRWLIAENLRRPWAVVVRANCSQGSSQHLLAESDSIKERVRGRSKSLTRSRAPHEPLELTSLTRTSLARMNPVVEVKATRGLSL